MHRNSILNAISDYQKTWLLHPELCKKWNFDHEKNVIKTCLDFINSNPNCFERSNPKGHLTGSALVVSRDLKRVLLTHHRKLNLWLQLGGHADGNPDLSEVAMTEAHEESGLKHLQFMKFADKAFGLAASTPLPFDLDAHLIPKSSKDDEHIHYDIRYIVIALDEKYSVSEESHDLRWFTLEEARQITPEESMHRQFAKLEVLASLIAS